MKCIYLLPVGYLLLLISVMPTPTVGKELKRVKFNLPKKQVPLTPKVKFPTNVSNFKDFVSISNERSNSLTKDLSNRDSYAEAAQSFGGQQQMTSSYQVPQNTYSSSYSSSNTGNGYYTQPYGYGGSNVKSSKSNDGGLSGVGVLGLLGLFGLLGVIPLIKLGLVAMIAFMPFLIPLGILKLPLVLLKPVLTFSAGRDNIQANDLLTMLFQVTPEYVVEKMDLLQKFDRYLAGASGIKKAAIKSPDNDSGESNSSITVVETIRREDDRCLERIACEGLFTSIPRIFMRVLGDNSFILMGHRPPKRKRNSRIRRSITGKIETEHTKKNLRYSSHIVDATGLSISQYQDVDYNKPRRKDLATMAVDKLKHNQYLIKKQSLTEDLKNSEDACKQYKCSTLF